MFVREKFQELENILEENAARISRQDLEGIKTFLTREEQEVQHVWDAHLQWCNIDLEKVKNLSQSNLVIVYVVNNRVDGIKKEMNELIKRAIVHRSSSTMALRDRVCKS